MAKGIKTELLIDWTEVTWRTEDWKGSLGHWWREVGALVISEALEQYMHETLINNSVNFNSNGGKNGYLNFVSVPLSKPVPFS